MTIGRTILSAEDAEKGIKVGNYRPITCLSLMWKSLTGVILDTIYDHLARSKLLPEEQKGCRKNCRGSKDHLLIDKAVVKNCKRCMVGLSTVWIDYRKAYKVSHSWIQKALQCVQ